MSEKRLKQLAEQKQLLVVQSDVNRRLIEVEQLALRSRINSFRDAVRDYRWPLLFGAFGAGLLGARRGGRILRWLPFAISSLRAFRRSSQR